MTGERTPSPGARMLSALIEGQRRVLERIASGVPLEEILETLVRLVEEQAGDMRCAVLLADSQQQRLRFAAAPSIPEDYKLGIEPHLLIAPDKGSCGTAAYLRQPVYTRDTAADPLWENCRDIAVRNGLRAIWSTPILSRGVVLGTFAMYYGEPRLPSDDHIRLIDMATQMARVAIEAKGDEMLSALFEGAPGGIAVTDLAGNMLRVSRAFAELLGYTSSELQGRNIVEITSDEDQDALVRKLLPLGNQELLQHRRYRSKGGSVLRARERCSVRRDAADRPGYVLIRIEKMAEAGNDPLERLSRRELQVLELVTAGHSSKDIGVRLHISATSVDTYRGRIMVKLGLTHLAGLVRFAMEHGVSSGAS